MIYQVHSNKKYSLNHLWQNIFWDAHFWKSFFEFESAAYCKKRTPTTSLPSNNWPFLFFQGFSYCAASWKRKSISFPSLVNLRSKSNFAPIIWLSFSHKNKAGALVVSNLISHMILYKGCFEAKPYLRHA